MFRTQWLVACVIVLGAAWVALQQLPEGGWPTQLSLSEGTSRDDLESDESPEVDAALLEALVDAAASFAADRSGADASASVASSLPAPPRHLG